MRDLGEEIKQDQWGEKQFPSNKMRKKDLENREKEDADLDKTICSKCPPLKKETGWDWPKGRVFSPLTGWTYGLTVYSKGSVRRGYTDPASLFISGSSPAWRHPQYSQEGPGGCWSKAAMAALQGWRKASHACWESSVPPGRIVNSGPRDLKNLTLHLKTCCIDSNFMQPSPYDPLSSSIKKI